MPTLLQQHLREELGYQFPFNVTRVNAANAGAKLQYFLFIPSGFSLANNRLCIAMDRHRLLLPSV